MDPAVLADAVLVFHGLFIVWAALGALAVLRRPKLIWVHLPALAWAVWIETSGRICPLTPLENSLRRAAGEAGYSGGFIEHYLLSLIYPDGLTRSVQLALGLGLITFNVIVYAWAWRRRWRHA